MPAGGHPDWLRPDWDAPGVGALMTTRAGGISEGAFASMNLRDGLGDSPAAVVASGRKVSPAASARAMLMRAKPSESPWPGTHTGRSPQGATSFSARKSAGTKVNFAPWVVTARMP